MYCHPYFAKCSAIQSALALTCCSRTAVPYESQLFQPIGGVGAMEGAPSFSRILREGGVLDLLSQDPAQSSKAPSCRIERDKDGAPLIPVWDDPQVASREIHKNQIGVLFFMARIVSRGVGRLPKTKDGHLSRPGRVLPSYTCESA